MAKADLSYILARAKASLANKPAPVNPAIVHELAPACAPSVALPLASLIAQAAAVPETEWEKALRLATAQDKPVLRLGKDKRDLNKPYFYKGKVGEPEPLSLLPPGLRSADGLKQAKAEQAQATAQAEQDAPFTGTPQQRIAYNNAKAKAARGQRLTHADKHILYKFRVALILAKRRKAV